jgi:pilus assembly protein CpaB
VSAGRRRRRALILLSLALACGGLAASQVSSRASAVEREVGPLVPVVAARQDIAAGTKLEAGQLTVREVPQRFVPPDTLASAGEAVGVRLQAAIPAGGYLTQEAIEKAGGAGGDPDTLRPGERAVEVAAAGGEGLAGTGPGGRVDVLITSEHRSFVALEDVQVLALRQGSEGKSLATLRVGLRQAVYLTAAQSFAREIRLLPRPEGERPAGRAASVSASDL